LNKKYPYEEYKGQWKNDLYDGLGVEKKEGAKYEG